MTMLREQRVAVTVQDESWRPRNGIRGSGAKDCTYYRLCRHVSVEEPEDGPCRVGVMYGLLHAIARGPSADTDMDMRV